MSAPSAPKGLGPAGKRLWSEVVKGLPPGWELDERELTNLSLAARQADDLDRLEKVIGKEGVTSTGSMGQRTVHPAVQEARMARLAISRLIGAIELPDSEEQGKVTASLRGQQAANARWRRANG